MKIYTRVVCGWQPDGTLKVEEAESFDYEGPVAQCKEAGNPPPAPDYTQGAYDTANSSRVNQYTPFGNLTWTPGTPAVGANPGYWSYPNDYIDPESGPMSTGNPVWIPPSAGTPARAPESRIELTPEAQRALDANMTTSADLSEMAQQQVSNLPSQPFDMTGVQDISDQAYAAQTRRLDPQWAQRASEQETNLRNQGLVPGGEAYDNAMRVFNQGRNDAYDTARLSAFGLMPQTFQLASAAYNQPLNYLNALRSGVQIQNPQFMSTPGANVLGAQQALGQYQQGNYQSQVMDTAAQNQLTGQIMASLLKMAASSGGGGAPS